MNKIVFVSTSSSLFKPDDLENSGLGGTEALLINLARHFAKKNDVTVFCNCEQETEHLGVKYRYVEDSTYCDYNNKVVIVLRDTNFVKIVNPKKKGAIKVILWLHDFALTPTHNELNNVVDLVDKIVCVSNWHKKDILENFNVPEDLIQVIYNGADENIFNFSEQKIPGKIIYTSTPFRGLSELLEIFPQIKKKVPHATLHIFSGMVLYKDGRPDEFNFLYNKAKRMKNVYFHGVVSRDILSKHLKESEIMLYPNTYNETFCLCCAESILCGTPVVSSSKGALPEVVKNCGFLNTHETKSGMWYDMFVMYATTLLQNVEFLKEIREKCKTHTFGLDKFFKEWDRIQV